MPQNKKEVTHKQWQNSMKAAEMSRELKHLTSKQFKSKFGVTKKNRDSLPTYLKSKLKSKEKEECGVNCYNSRAPKLKR